MGRLSSSVILIMAISKAAELELVAGLGYCEFALPSQGDMALRDDSIQSQQEPAVCHWPFQSVLSIGIQDTKELNKTYCLSGGTGTLLSFCACPPSSCGWNCEHDWGKEIRESVSHDPWLPKKCSMCKCWHGQLHCSPQTFPPGRGKQIVPSFALSDGHVIDEHFPVSRAPELTYCLRAPLFC
ncbi:protein CRIPTO3-like [Halichoerus grypus]|uniref:putative teratocarcinoma-derived growth factor 3 n=1 Tax=Halichoerus grypus TaxID=9711 RepID=UPI0016596446|nr:putative teratocarcinoma-derived growth factor 3 [Halichoerus grypus]